MTEEGAHLVCPVADARNWLDCVSNCSWFEEDTGTFDKKLASLFYCRGIPNRNPFACTVKEEEK